MIFVEVYSFEIIMYRIVLLSACVVGALAFPEKKCMRLMHPDSIACCMKDTTDISKDEEIQECFQVPQKPHSCDREICIAVKKGIASSDGTIDKKAVLEMLTKNMDKDPELLKIVKEECIDGDLAKYGPPDFCDLMKLKHCMAAQYVAACPEWDDSGSCKGIKDLVAECKM